MVACHNYYFSIDFKQISDKAHFHLQQNSPRLWAFLAAVYWVSLVTYYLLWKAYKHVSVIRATALKSPEVRSEQFAILVRDIPSLLEGETRKEQVDAYFKDIYPDTFYRSMVVTDNKEVGFTSISFDLLLLICSLYAIIAQQHISYLSVLECCKNRSLLIRYLHFISCL